METPPSSRSGNRVLIVEGRAQGDLGIGGGAWHPSGIRKAGLKGRLLLANRKELLGGAAAWWSQDLQTWTEGWGGGSRTGTGCSQPTALCLCHGLTILPGTWQPQLGTWHNQPVTQTPTWDCH